LLRGVNTVDLFWQGAISASIDIYRNGTRIRTVSNMGTYTDSTGNKSNARHTYKMYAAGTQTCSNEVMVRFGGPPN
jgi:hypothetical protein